MLIGRGYGITTMRREISSINILLRNLSNVAEIHNIFKIQITFRSYTPVGSSPYSETYHSIETSICPMKALWTTGTK